MSVEYFAPALKKSFQATSLAQMTAKITDYHSKHACLMLMKEIFAKLACSFALIHDMESLKEVLKHLIPYEKTLMVEASFWILNSHLAKIDHDLTKRTAVVRAGDEGLRFFKNTFFYLLHRGDPASIYHLTLYFVDQLVSCGLYHHVREVWKSYRKAGIRFPGHKLDKHRNTFIIDENGDKVHVIAGFNDVIMDY